MRKLYANSRARIAFKALALFACLLLAVVVVDPIRPLARLSIYNTLVPSRQRLPWGERPELAYSLTMGNYEAMFASHVIAQPKAADEFRVVLIGDSSTWGFLLKPEDTLTGLLNARGLQQSGKRVRFYNLGYPDFSLSKDGALLVGALRHQPDMIVWLVTLRSFPKSLQAHALVETLPRAWLTTAPEIGVAVEPPVRSLSSTRRELADLARLQLFGLAWAATGIDQHYPTDYTPVQRDLDADTTFGAFTAPSLPREQLMYGVFDGAQKRMGDVPLIVVNEPMLISSGANSALRYNFFYPRWAYDQYRVDLSDTLHTAGIRYLDYWDRVPQSEFTNSAVHVTPAGSRIVADQLARDLFAAP
jgi:hypothetical protein